VVDPVEPLEAGDRGDGGARAGSDENPLGRELTPVDVDRPRVAEPRLPAYRLESLRELLVPTLLRLAQRVLPVTHAREVELAGGGKPELRAEPPEVAGEVGRNEVRLRRLARDVRARAAPARRLDQRDGRAELGRRLARGIAGGRAGAEHDEVEGRRHAPILTAGPPRR
jgi:hypothetical protein